MSREVPVREIMVALEDEENTVGWDRPPLLVAIVRTAFGGALAHLFGQLPYMHLPQLMGSAGTQLLEDPEYTRQLLAGLPGFYGLVAVSEGWAPPPEMSLEEIQALREAGRNMGDVPGGRETRLLAAATLDGRVWVAQRIRGDEHAHVSEVDVSDPAASGELCVATRGLLATLAMRMDSVDERYMEAIARDPVLHGIVKVDQGATRPNSSNEA